MSGDSIGGVKSVWVSILLKIASSQYGLQNEKYFIEFLLDQFLGTLTVRGVSRVNYEVPRLSKLHEDARRCSKNFQQVWYKLELLKVCRDDMPCKVIKKTT